MEEDGVEERDEALLRPSEAKSLLRSLCDTDFRLLSDVLEATGEER